MTDTSALPSSPPPPPTGKNPTSLWRTLLYILIPVVGLLLLIAAFVFALWGRSGPVDQSVDLAPGTSLSVKLPNAAIILEPSADDEVHVRMTGSYFGNEPTLSARTDGGVTEVRGGCRAQLFSRCSVTVTVQLPKALPVTAAGENGRIAASGLTGRVTLTTTNGAVETDGTVGPVDLQSTNGNIRVTDAVSKTVSTSTTNGSVALQFIDAPETIDAGSTNGEITVRVPVGGVTYRITAQTTNGTVTDDTVPSDSTSRRSITARTTNGSITIEAVR
ncbi:DUF4097 family beta strand repeat-containing protein [Cryobacterium adonitolivorans]|nr:DUF4097 family beta strand repeat-containing protein [Cryobacterium adonitolivorans]